MEIKSNPITRTIYRDSSITLSLFVRPVQVTDVGKKYTVDVWSSLYLQMVLPYDRAYSMTTEEFKTTSFPIRQSNILEVCEFFSQIYNWFDLNNKIFVSAINTQQLCISAEYKDLELFTARGYFDDYQMRAAPAIVEVSQGKFMPGIYLNINMKENQVKLSQVQVKRIFGILRNFSFPVEILLSMEALRNSIATGSIITQDEYEKAKKASGYIKKDGAESLKW